MPYRIFAVAMLLSLVSALNVQAANIVNVEPSVQPLAAAATDQGPSKRRTMHALPAPVITEVQAFRQPDGSIAVNCHNIKNPQAAPAYLQNERNHQTPVENK